MTTITQKKNYKTPHCIFVSLEEEAELLSVSGRADKNGELATFPQRDYEVSKPWNDNPWGNE